MFTILTTYIYIYILLQKLYYSTDITLIICSLAAQRSINEAVHLRLDISIDLSKLATSEGVIANARLPETVDALEELTIGWCQQIEQVRQ